MTRRHIPENAAKQWLIRVQPAMDVPNSLEFKQRLQWLSEGMLAIHIGASDRQWPPSQEEIDEYKLYKQLIL